MTQYLRLTGKCIDCEHAEWVRGSYFCDRRKIRESVLYKVGTCQRFSAKKVERKEPQTISVEASVIASLEKENAKLRELVRDMFEVIEASDFDPYVERRGKRGSYYEEDPSWRVKIRERVREMGIEVDE